jgi:hypothetical protein
MKLSRATIFIFLITIVSFTGCKKNVVLNNKQAMLFQVDYVNYAWGYQHSGLIIDNEGNIMTYKNPENWNFPDKDLNLSQSLARANIGSCKLTGNKVPPEELKKYAGYIKNITLSKVTAPKNVAADAGSTEYICYQYSDSAAMYKGTIIKMEGDFTCENLNFFSKKVSAWLKSINDSIVTR